MTYPKIGNEIDNLGTTEIEADYRTHTWDCCWLRTIGQVFTVLAIIAGIALVVWLTVGVTGQVDANLSI